VVGHGPSYRDYDFIKNFDGLILSVDITTTDLIEHDIIPNYHLYGETQKSVKAHLHKFMPDYYKEDRIKDKMTVIYREETTDCLPYRIDLLGLKSQIFNAERYGNANAINNVGLYSIIFADEILKPDEIHLIGLDYSGGEYVTKEDLDVWINAMIESTYHYYRNKSSNIPIIDHSNGNFPPYIKGVNY
jgi:hypothetical protein